MAHYLFERNRMPWLFQS